MRIAIIGCGLIGGKRAESLKGHEIVACADPSLGRAHALLLASRIGLAKDFTPNVADYWQRLQKRDGYRRAVEAENLASDRQGIPRRAY